MITLLGCDTVEHLKLKSLKGQWKLHMASDNRIFFANLWLKMTMNREIAHWGYNMFYGNETHSLGKKVVWVSLAVEHTVPAVLRIKLTWQIRIPALWQWRLRPHWADPARPQRPLPSNPCTSRRRVSAPTNGSEKKVNFIQVIVLSYHFHSNIDWLFILL